MTETHATSGTEPVFPPGRYGHRREPAPPRRRWTTVIVAAVVVAAMVGISIKMFQQYGQPEYAPQVRRYFDVTDSGDIRRVRRAEAGR